MSAFGASTPSSPLGASPAQGVIQSTLAGGVQAERANRKPPAKTDSKAPFRGRPGDAVEIETAQTLDAVRGNKGMGEESKDDRRRHGQQEGRASQHRLDVSG